MKFTERVLEALHRSTTSYSMMKKSILDLAGAVQEIALAMHSLAISVNAHDRIIRQLIMLNKLDDGDDDYIVDSSTSIEDLIHMSATKTNGSEKPN